MNWQQVERPGIARGEHVTLNTHVLKTLDRAIQCANWLVSQGFEVLSVQAGRRNPRIEIASSRLCEKLEGGVCMTERNLNQPTKRTWVAIRFGCEVRWNDEAKS